MMALDIQMAALAKIIRNWFDLHSSWCEGGDLS